MSLPAMTSKWPRKVVLESGTGTDLGHVRTSGRK